HLATVSGSNRAVHLDEGVTLALRSGVNEASQDVFADTGFATDQEGHPRLRTLSQGHEVKDPSGLQNGRDTLARRVLSGHLPAPPGPTGWRRRVSACLPVTLSPGAKQYNRGEA